MEEGRGRTRRGQKQEEVILGALVLERRRKRFFPFRPAGKLTNRLNGAPANRRGGEGH
jgi:hypothetical protein